MILIIMLLIWIFCIGYKIKKTYDEFFDVHKDVKDES